MDCRICLKKFLICWIKPGPGVGFNINGWSRRLIEIEILSQVSEDGYVFSHRRTRIGTSVRLWVDALAAHKVVFDKFDICIEAESLVINITFLGVRTDDEPGTRKPYPF